MASTADRPAVVTQSNQQPETLEPRSEPSQQKTSTRPVEMETLPSSDTGSAQATNVAASQIPPSSTRAEDVNQVAVASKSSHEPQNVTSSSMRPAPPADLVRSETEAIGPSTDTPAANPDNTNGPVLVIMLLLTTGARHPYKIDEKYLRKRNVSVDDMDPYSLGVYTLKELIWRDWREEWEPRPTSPSSIRLIHFGRMLDDKAPLKDCRFQTDTPNVVHMTVKPQEVVDEEDAKTSKGASRRDGEEEPTAGCRCIIL